MSKNDEYFMKQAIDMALKARHEGNAPFGALLVKDGEVVMKDANKINTLSDPTYHAELGLIRKFCSENNISDLSDYSLYTSCEPCVMCSGAMVWSKLGRLVYSLSNAELAEISGRGIMVPCEDVFAESFHKPTVVENVLNEEGRNVFAGYYSKEDHGRNG